MRAVLMGLVLTAITVVPAAPAQAFPWSAVRKGGQRPMTMVTFGQRDLLYEFAPSLVKRLPKTSGSTPKAVQSAFYSSALEAAGGAGPREALAEFTLSSGKLKVTKSFRLGPLKVNVGEFDLRKWAAVAGGAYIVCSGGRPLDQMSEAGFEDCMNKAIDKAAAAFGWLDPRNRL